MRLEREKGEMNSGENRCCTPGFSDEQRESGIISEEPLARPRSDPSDPTCAERRIFDTIRANLRLSQEVIPVVGAFE